MLLSETLPRARRGAGMYAYNLAMLAGFLVAAVSNQLLQPLPWGWRASAGLMGAPALVLAGLLPFLAESPQALLQRGDGAAAERVRGRTPARAGPCCGAGHGSRTAARSGTVTLSGVGPPAPPPRPPARSLPHPLPPRRRPCARCGRQGRTSPRSSLR